MGYPIIHASRPLGTCICSQGQDIGEAWARPSISPLYCRTFDDTLLPQHASGRRMSSLITSMCFLVPQVLQRVHREAVSRQAGILFLGGRGHTPSS